MMISTRHIVNNQGKKGLIIHGSLAQKSVRVSMKSTFYKASKRQKWAETFLGVDHKLGPVRMTIHKH